MEPGKDGAAPADQVAMQVVRHIRARMEQGLLRRGERLPPEREFARELKVSRASLRAGVGYLAAMGVLTVRHGVGTFVADGPPALSSASFEMIYAMHGFTSRQMFEARLILESNLAWLAAERGTSEHMGALAAELEDMEATAEDPEAYLIHDVSFHRILGEAAGNPILSALMETISASFYDTRRLTVRGARDLAESTRMHRAIYEAVRTHQPAEARACMEQHLRRAERGLASEAALPGTQQEQHSPAAQAPLGSSSVIGILPKRGTARRRMSSASR